MDIEQDIREAIVGTIGLQRSEMWFGKEVSIAIFDACVQVHAVNAFAADFVGKRYLSKIQTHCRPLLAKGQRIEIVSPESYVNSERHSASINYRAAEVPSDHPVAKPRFDANLLTRKHTGDVKTKRFSNVVDTMPTNHLSCTFLEDSTPVTREVACKKQSKASIPPTAKSKKKTATSNIVPVSQKMHDNSDKNVPSNTNKQPLQHRQNRTKSTATCHRMTPQELNGQIISTGKKTLAGLFPTTEMKATSTPSQRKTQSGNPGGFAKVSGGSVTPAVERDEANRNVVLVSDRTASRTKATPGSTVTWDRFVVGPSNRLAVKTAELAINHSGHISPIYIYGPTSVGKTHLLEMIKSSARRNPQAKPLVMMTAEQFTSSFIEVVISKQTPMFRNKFRGISALLVDDIQFFAGKASTQTEFQRTLDQLKMQGMQVVLTGDRPLNSLADLLKPEIIARLEAGMSCEIKPADSEMLLAIFKQMAASRNLNLSDEVCRHVVSHLSTHARQLSGAINRLHASMLTTHRPITMETVDTILEDMIRNNRKPVRLQDIEKAVCETMQLNGALLQSKSRAKQATQPRMLAMWLARKYTRSALSEIGKHFGNRSHSTVVSAQKKVDQWLQQSPDLGLCNSSLSVAEVIQKVERLLHSH